MDSLCHPWFTTANLSYRFLIVETSVTASCGTTGISSLLWYGMLLYDSYLRWLWPEKPGWCSMSRYHKRCLTNLYKFMTSKSADCCQWLAIGMPLVIAKRRAQASRALVPEPHMWHLAIFTISLQSSSALTNPAKFVDWWLVAVSNFCNSGFHCMSNLESETLKLVSFNC